MGILPNFNGQIVGNKGYLTTYGQQIFRNLQKNSQTLPIPMLSTDDINTLNNNPNSTGLFVYNKDTNQVMVNINGVFKTVTTS